MPVGRRPQACGRTYNARGAQEQRGGGGLEGYGCAARGDGRGGGEDRGGDAASVRHQVGRGAVRPAVVRSYTVYGMCDTVETLYYYDIVDVNKIYENVKPSQDVISWRGLLRSRSVGISSSSAEEL